MTVRDEISEVCAALEAATNRLHKLRKRIRNTDAAKPAVIDAMRSIDFAVASLEDALP